MRVVAGSLGGRRLKAPSGTRVRPTTDRVRESLFSILGERVRDARVLDLFAGSGALGIEALSRGARQIVFIEKDPVVSRVLGENLRSLDCLEHVVLVRAPVEAALGRLEGVFDIVFADPPYRTGAATRVLPLLGPLLATGGLAIIEHDRREELADEAAPLERVDVRPFGDTVVSFYARSN